LRANDYIDILFERIPNKFLLVNAVAGRAKQIMEGSLPYVDNFNPENPIETAMKEIAEERISVEISKEEKKTVRHAFDFEREEAPSVIETLAKKKKKKYSAPVKSKKKK